MPEPGTANLPIAEAVRDEIKVEAAKRKITMKALIDELWAAHKGQGSLTNSGDAAIAHSGSARISSPGKEGIPPNNHQNVLGEKADEVLSFLLKHWADENFRACISALVRIWDVGDPDIQGSITRNCNTFERSSGMVETLREIQVQPGPISREHEERIAALLPVARGHRPKTPSAKNPDQRGARS